MIAQIWLLGADWESGESWESGETSRNFNSAYWLVHACTLKLTLAIASTNLIAEAGKSYLLLILMRTPS